MSSRWRRIGPLLGLLLLCALFALWLPDRFLQFYNLQVIAMQTVFVALVALGMTFVVVAGGIDLSVGSVVAFVGVFAALAIGQLGIHPLAAFAICLAMGAAFGAAMGAIDASNMMKPALARGELQCIGATTLDEYRVHIEKDPALERRFSPIFVDEPSVEDTLEMLRGLRPRYEAHHQVKIDDSALDAATKLSHRYVADRPQTVAVEASWTPAGHSSDGIDIEIRLGNDVLHRESSVRTPHDVALPLVQLKPGDRLDLIVGPGAEAKGDRTRYHILLREVDDR